MGAVSDCLVVFLLIHYAAAYDGVYREEGDACGPENKWVCKSIAKCPAAQKELKTRRNPSPQICSVPNGIPVVCCPPSDRLPEVNTDNRAGDTPSQKPKKSISQTMCEKYAKYVFTKKRRVSYGVVSFSNVDTCGRIEEPLIVGGRNAALKEFPHMAQIGYQYKDQILYVCGGSLISERWVLSAAHCTEAPTFGKAQFARLGELDIASDTDGARPEVLRIVERINHEGWNQDELYNDIALYKLERNVQLTPYIRPICLQVEHTFKGVAGIATGWGHTEWEGEGSTNLKKVWLDLVDNARCNRSYGTQFQIPEGIVDSKMLCTFGRGVKDTCQGDSGGPLQIPLSSPYCMYSQIGVTSFGIECASRFPGVYSRVSHYVPWIEKHVWPDAQV